MSTQTDLSALLSGMNGAGGGAQGFSAGSPNLGGLGNDFNLNSDVFQQASQRHNALLQNLLLQRQIAEQQEKNLLAKQLCGLQGFGGMTAAGAGNGSGSLQLLLQQQQLQKQMQLQQAAAAQGLSGFSGLSGLGGGLGPLGVYGAAGNNGLGSAGFGAAASLVGLGGGTGGSSSSALDAFTLNKILQNQAAGASANAAAAASAVSFDLQRAALLRDQTAVAAQAALVANTGATGANGERKRKGRTGTFPQKLHQMLSDLERQGQTDIASFLPHGRAFAIHKPRDFVKSVMVKYFRMSRFSSFQRQLNLYDFQRITEGPDKGAYFHELFVQGRPILSTMMKRNKIKGVKLQQQQQKTPANAEEDSKVAAKAVPKHEEDHGESDDEGDEEDEE